MGNGDGIADYLQNNVASIHTKDYLHFVTLSTPEPGKLTSCKMNDTASIENAPSDCTLPLGLISFKIENLIPGSGTTLTINLPTGSEFDTFYKYGTTFDYPAEHWYEFMYDQTSETGAVLEGDTITLYLKDGQPGDDDLSANGVISDPGGPGILGVGDNTDPTLPGYQLDDGDNTSSGSGGIRRRRLLPAILNQLETKKRQRGVRYFGSAYDGPLKLMSGWEPGARRFLVKL